MFPILFSLGPITLYTFNVFLVIAFLSGGFAFWKRAHDEHYEDDQAFDLVLLSSLFGLLFSRIAFILFHFNDFQLNVLAWISLFQRPGLHELVGIVAGLWCLGWLAKRKKWDHFEIVDFGVMGLSIFLIIIWIARFFAGSQIGTQTNLPWGITFPNTFDARHPLQLYMVLVLLFSFFVLKKIEKKYRFYQWYRANKQSAQSGFVVGVFFILYGFFHLLFSAFRLTDIKIGFVSIDVLLYLGVMITGMAIIYLRSGHSTSSKKPAKRVVTPQNRVQLGWSQRLFRRR